MKNGKLDFEAWFKEVDKWVNALAGLSANDLPDWNYADAYADGSSPKAAARAALKNAKDEN